MGKLLRFLKLRFANKVWRKKNKNNLTSIGRMGNEASYNFMNSDRISVGEGSYGPLNIHSSGNPDEKLIIGKYCQISGYSHFLLGGEHQYKWISAYPFRELRFGKGISSFAKGPIILDDEVWVGHDALIMSGVHIGKGAVVAARSVVTSDVPPYAIVGGCPAKVIKMRFSDNVIQKLMSFDLPYHKLVEKDLEKLELEITDDNVDEIIEYFTRLM